MKSALFLAPVLLLAGVMPLAAQPYDGPKPDNPYRDAHPVDTNEDKNGISDNPDNPLPPGPSDPVEKPDNPNRDPHPTDPD